MEEYIWVIFAACLISGTATEPALRFRLTEPGDIVLHKDTLSLVNGTDMRVKCELSRPTEPEKLNWYDRSSKEQELVKWTKINDKAFGTQLASLDLFDLQKKDSGNYSCADKEYKRQLSLNVLYPPEKADIHSIENGSRRYLRCNADSSPPAKYWWKYSTSNEAKIIQNGPTILLPEVQNNNTWLHCFARNTMDPTVGSAVNSPVVQTAKRVEVNEVPAKIVKLPKSYTTYSGFTIDITCDVEGVPPPTVWWTKESETFIRDGNRLIEENVQESFAGIYVCNANNTAKHRGHATKMIEIKIFAQYQLWAIAVTVSGWMATLCVSLLVLVFIVRKRRRHEIPAKIVRLPKSYTTYSGFTIDITCDVEGVPPPTVWWTKESGTFVRDGNRLIEENVQESFAGIYVCNANNTAKHRGHATKMIEIKIVAQYQLWTIAVTVSGWMATLCVSLLVLVFIVRRRRRHESYRRMGEPPSMRLSEILRVDQSHDNFGQYGMATAPTVTREETGIIQDGRTRGQTENSWHSLCKESINNSQSAEETRRKTVYSTESDTARLHNVV